MIPDYRSACAILIIWGAVLGVVASIVVVGAVKLA